MGNRSWDEWVAQYATRHQHRWKIASHAWPATPGCHRSVDRGTCVDCVKIAGGHRTEQGVANGHGGQPERAGLTPSFGHQQYSIDTNNETKLSDRAAR